MKVCAAYPTSLELVLCRLLVDQDLISVVVVGGPKLCLSTIRTIMSIKSYRLWSPRRMRRRTALLQQILQAKPFEMVLKDRGARHIQRFSVCTARIISTKVTLTVVYCVSKTCLLTLSFNCSLYGSNLPSFGTCLLSLRNQQ